MIAKSFGFCRKKSLRERDVSASNFYEGVRPSSCGRRGDMIHVVCVDAQFFSNYIPQYWWIRDGTASGVAANGHLCGEGIARQAYANDS